MLGRWGKRCTRVLLVCVLGSGACYQDDSQAPRAQGDSKSDDEAESKVETERDVRQRVVPDLGSLPLFDESGKAINVVVLVIGSRSGEYLAFLHAKAKRKEPGIINGATLRGDRAYQYYHLLLGDLRGWAPNIHLLSFESGPANESISPFIVRADAVVVAGEGRLDDPLFAEVLARDQRHHDLAIALVGFDASRWERAGGGTPESAVPWAPESHVVALKALIKKVVNQRLQ